MASNGGQYDPRAQAMEEVHFYWRCIVCCMVALSPFIWNNSTFLGLNLFILIWTTPHGLNVTSAIPPFIYSVGPGNQFMLLDPDVFFAPSSVVDSSNYLPPFLFRLISLFFLKMGRKPYCPDGGKDKSKKKKKKDTDTARPSETPRITRISRPPVRVEDPPIRTNQQGILLRMLWQPVSKK